ncbi:MAG TPA: hypothetical protein VG871_10760, partial [Vicinamibacterales bacterium]|nr:hypothetical protein [Vicinamibacterales bacterium]
LAFATPPSWLADGKGFSIDSAVTSFGPVSYSVTRDGNTITAVVTKPARAKSVRLRLRLPHGARIARMRVGSRSLRFDASGTVMLPHGTRVRLTATLAAAS